MKVQVLTSVVVVLFLTACRGERPAAPDRTPVVGTQPQPQPAGEPELQEVDARYGIYLARMEMRTTISPDGRLRTVRTQNKSYGPADKVVERTEIRAGQLTPEQMAELARLFAGWETLNDVYENVPDGPDVRIEYGGKIVSGGTGLPRKVWDVHRRITELGTGMAVVEK